MEIKDWLKINLPLALSRKGNGRLVHPKREIINMIYLETIFYILGGLVVVIYGIGLLGKNIQKIMGEELEKVLKKAKDKPTIKGLVAGAAVTSLVQSNSIIILILMAFVSAGVMELGGAAGIMLGANIGATITAQLAACQVGIYFLPILIIGFLFYNFNQRRIYKYFGKAVFGLGILFLGIVLVFEGADLLQGNANFLEALNLVSSIPCLVILLGALLTIAIQSGSAAAVLIIALGVKGIVNLDFAIFFILGINLGISLKMLIFAYQGKHYSGRMAASHFVFNFLGIIIFLTLFPFMKSFIIFSSSEIGRQIANTHTFFNLINAIILFPFVPFLVGRIDKLLPRRAVKESKLDYLDKRLIFTPSIALSQANRGVVRMSKITYEMLENCHEMIFNGKGELLKSVKENEDKINMMTDAISNYLILVSQQSLSKKDSMKLYSLFHILTDIERMSDHILVIAQTANKITEQKIKFSDQAFKNLTAVFGKIKMTQNLVIRTLKENKLSLAKEIMEHENKVDEIIKKVQNKHLERMKKNICSPEAGNFFVTLLNNFERVGDHSDNIAYAVSDMFK